jgi:hypothetical protein
MLLKLIYITFVAAIIVSGISIASEREISPPLNHQIPPEKSEQNKQDEADVFKDSSSTKEEEQSLKGMTLIEKLKTILKDFEVEPYFIPAM